VGDLYPPSPREVSVKVEFFLQLQSLVSGVGRSLSFGLTIGIDCTWNRRKGVRI